MKKIFFVSLGIVIADQITKLLVKGFSIPLLNIYVKGMELYSSIPVIGDFFRITYIENPGMAFGIDIGSKLFLSIFSIIASIILAIYLYKIENASLLFRLSLAIILGGAAGNLIDRTFYGVIFGEAPLFYGKVVDFIDVDFIDISLFGYSLTRWPVFNIADSAVSIGMLLAIFSHKNSIVEQPKEIAL